jgi:hypothetical protein
MIRFVYAAALLIAAAPAAAAPILPDFRASAFIPGAPIDNRYFPLLPGQRNVLVARGVDEEGEAFTERTVRSFAGRGPKILGVRVTTMLDKAFEDDLLVERTRDYFAQDRRGNVWYMGEDVTNFRYDDDGNLIGTDDESAWRAGRNGAKPGFIMPVSTRLGFNYFQEHAPNDEALDHGLTFAVLDKLKVGQATFFKVLQVLERTPAEPGARDFKYYAPGFGLIREEEGLDRNLENPELTFNVIPLPPALPLLLAGLAGLAALARRRRASDA